MQVGETYGVNPTSHSHWMRVTRRITRIEDDVVHYFMENEPARQVHSRAIVTDAIHTGTWVLLYPSHIALPLGV